MNALQHIATINPIEPLIPIIQAALADVYSVVQSYGWTMLVLAALVKLIFWPLNAMQFRSMARMQQLHPQIKALQAKYNSKDPKTSQKLNSETMALYREHKVNPLAGCFPMLLQMPILISLYYAITESRARFTNATWLWIGSPISFHFPNILAIDLAKSDLVLLAAYVISMYFTVRSSSPALDAQQAKQQRILALFSPALTGYFGFRYRWPSALLIYWLGSNLFAIFQQRYMLKNPDGLNAKSWSFLLWAILSSLLPSIVNTYIDGWLTLSWIVSTFLLFASINGALEYSLSAARLRQR